MTPQDKKKLAELKSEFNTSNHIGCTLRVGTTDIIYTDYRLILNQSVFGWRDLDRLSIFLKKHNGRLSGDVIRIPIKD
jgi:hypothetical protein